VFIRVATVASFALALLAPHSASAEVLIQIDKSSQRMTVSVDGAQKHVWPVSTGRSGYGTPNGRFRPQWLARSHFSRKYYNSPMPHSIFFHGGFAIHGTTYISRLGGPASHGCVRLHPGHAAALFALVSQHGKSATRIEVTGSSGTAVAAKRSRAPKVVRARVREEESFRDFGDDLRPTHRIQYEPMPSYRPFGFF
jgi:hypothetical protein